MAAAVEISIPSTSIISNTSKPYTVYNISLRLPLRSYTLQKRFSEFTTFHSSLTSEVGAAPPSPLPSKSWFTRTISNPDLTEHRRQGLETYLLAISSAEDHRWRNTSAWKSFLNLPSNTTLRSKTANGLHGAIAGPGRGPPTTDPVVWLDHHREMKSQLHDARLALTRRDQATSAQAQHENGASAKKSLVKAGTMIAALDQGLQNLGGDSWSGGKLGEGEMARRRDMVKNARREREGLENLLNAMVAKSKVDETVASAPEKDKAKLFANGGAGPKPSGRVLGKETNRTRALDNRGVVQLQQQMMQEQDEDVMVLARAVAKQKELSIAINQELAEQQEMLNGLDEDVDRVQGKLDVAGKRIKKIS